MNAKEYRELLARYVSLFEEAEKQIKEVERLDGELSVPSLNELRYAGYQRKSSPC
jgi:predicted ribonuclease toxin of YeeF-YezG toxin-antitoxin module